MSTALEGEGARLSSFSAAVERPFDGAPGLELAM
jgi:hypothetical protein